MKRWCSPFIMFLILLIVLIISIIFSKYLPIEGFISYNPVRDEQLVIVPVYSTTQQLLKVYDSVYFDPQTGNMLELFGTPSSDNTSTSNDISTLTNMVLIPRQGTDVVFYGRNTNDPPFSNNMIENQYLNLHMISSYEAWFYPNAGSLSSLPFNYQIFYFPWKINTVILINDCTIQKIIGVFPFINSTKNTSRIQPISPNFRYPTQKIEDFHPNNETYIDVLPQYLSQMQGFPTFKTPTQLYQLESNIWFDTTNAVLMMMKSGTSTDLDIEIGVSFTIKSQTDTSILPCFVTSDNVGQNIVVCTAFPNNCTMVSILCVNENNNTILEIRNVVLFDPSVSGGISHKHNDHHDSSLNSPKNRVTSSPDANKYILKSQIVPPVCPACPACNNNTCDACKTKTTLAPLGNNNSLSSLIANSYTVGMNTGTGTGTITDSGTIVGGQDDMTWQKATSNIVTGAEGTVGNVLDTAVGGTALLGLGTVAGATTLGTGVAGDIKDLGLGVTGDVAGVANNLVDAVKDIVKTTMDDLTGQKGDKTHKNKPSENETDQTQTPTYLPTTPVSNMGSEFKNVPGGYYTACGPGLNNYYGALSNRNASNFMPVTSDFSKFGR
jgi:hypothetical protein